MRRITMAALVGVGCCTLWGSEAALARVVGFEVVGTASPALDGATFGAVGAYERIDAIASFAIDPTTERAARIVDLDAAPRDADGQVRFSTEVVILRPVDPERAAGVLLYEVTNRGRNLSFNLLNLANATGMPTSEADAGDGHLLAEGYTLVWSGWQTDLGGDLLELTLPVVQGITGPSREEFVFDDDAVTHTVTLTYPAADLDPDRARLSVRQRPTDPRSTAPGLGFRFLSPTEIEITRPAGLDGGAVYEFVYEATDPVPAGLAFAATSDLVSFLRGGDGHDVASPLQGIEHTLALGISQSGRFLRDMIYQGFNQDEAGARVFDGAIPHIAGSRKTFTNARFAQPGRYSRQHEDHDVQGDQFPFSYAVTDDPLTGARGSILDACTASDTCPKLMHTDTSTEFWQARAALVSTSPSGEPLTMPDDVRLYFMAGAPHFTAWSARSAESRVCRFPTNPSSPAPVMRALLEALRAWVVDGTEPPASRFPSLADGTLVGLDELRLPTLPDGAYVPVYNALRVVDHATVPPQTGAAYPTLVPALNDRFIPQGGIASPQVAEPLGVFWGWNLRRDGFAAGQLCGLTGSFLATPNDPEAAAAMGLVPLGERYPDADAYARAVEDAARALVAERLMRAEDVAFVVERARADYAALD